MEHPSAHKGSYVRRKRPGQGGPRRTLAQIDKDAKALALYLQGKTYREVADVIGWKSPATALMAVRRAIADRQNDALGQTEEFVAAVARIQKAIAECQAIIDTPHYLAAPGGKLATDPDGNLVLDDGPKQRAITEMRHLNDQMIMIMDLKPAEQKQRVEVVTEDVVDREIAELAKELAGPQGKPPPPES